MYTWKQAARCSDPSDLHAVMMFLHNLHFSSPVASTMIYQSQCRADCDFVLCSYSSKVSRTETQPKAAGCYKSRAGLPLWQKIEHKFHHCLRPKTAKRTPKHLESKFSTKKPSHSELVGMKHLGVEKTTWLNTQWISKFESKRPNCCGEKTLLHNSRFDFYLILNYIYI